MSAEPRWGTRAVPRALLCAVVLLVALVLVAAQRATSEGDASTPTPTPTPTSAATTAPSASEVVVSAAPARRTGAVRPESPTSVTLPSRVVVPVRAVSTTQDGTLDVPLDIRTAGWWRGGARLGDPLGSTLIAAHVDSTTQGLGPYAALLGVRPGQRFVLASATMRQTFTTESLRLVDQGPILRRRWMYSPDGARRLVLVTCAPPYIPSRGGYQKLAVVTASPLSAPVPRGP